MEKIGYLTEDQTRGVLEMADRVEAIRSGQKG